MNPDRLATKYQPYLLSLFRFITGLLLFQYGVAKIFKFPPVSAFILSGEMAFAYFLGHMLKSGEPVLHPLNNGGTAAILFCFACLYLVTAGGGPISVDAAIGDRSRQDHFDDVGLGRAAE